MGTFGRKHLDTSRTSRAPGGTLSLGSRLVRLEGHIGRRSGRVHHLGRRGRFLRRTDTFFTTDHQGSTGGESWYLLRSGQVATKSEMGVLFVTRRFVFPSERSVGVWGRGQLLKGVDH